MKRAVLVLLVACHAGGGGGDDYPTGTGGGGPIAVGGGTGDGGAGNAGVQIEGRVCLLKDLRHPTVCSGTGAGGLLVSLATPTTKTAKVTTDDNGQFSIVAPLGAGFTWRVTGATDQRIVPSLMPFGTDHTIPVIGTEDYNTLLGANHQVIVDEGSVVVRVVSGGAPIPHVTVASTTLALEVAVKDAAFYDDDRSQDVWNQTDTQSGGVVWIPVVALSPSPPTTGTITLARQDGATVTTVTTAATVESQWITFLTMNVP